MGRSPRDMSRADASGRIVLVRHGRSSHVHSGWIDGNGFRAWREAYEGAGIREDERVPADLEDMVGRQDLVLSSDAPRAVESARLLAPGRAIVVSSLLRELDLEAFSLGGLRLPLGAWALAVGARTLFMTLRRKYPSAAETARVNEAATWLAELSATQFLIVVVTHAKFRASLSTRLVQNGWHAEPERRSLRPWSTWLLRRSPA